MDTLTCPVCDEMNEPGRLVCKTCHAWLVEPSEARRLLMFGSHPSPFDDPEWVERDKAEWDRKREAEEAARKR